MGNKGDATGKPAPTGSRSAASAPSSAPVSQPAAGNPVWSRLATAPVVQRAPDLTSTAHYPTAGEQKTIGGLFNPSGSNPDPVIDAAGFKKDMADTLTPYIAEVAKSAASRRDTDREVPRSGIDEIADVAEDAVLTKFADYLKAAGSAPKTRLRSTLKLVPTTETAETAEVIKDWVESRMEKKGGDLISKHNVVGGSRPDCGDTRPAGGWSSDCRDRDLFKETRDEIIAAHLSELKTIALFFPAYEKDGVSYLQTRIGSPPQGMDDKEFTRKSRWLMLGTLIHEMLHSLAHPDFRAAVDRTQSRNLGIEGFDEYFARQVYGELKAAAEGLDMPQERRLKIEGETGPDITIPERQHYQEFVAKVEKIRDQTNEQSLRAAYFLGKAEYIGLGSWTKKEADSQDAARHPANIAGLGLLGLYLGKDAALGIEARYARVVFGRGQGHQLQVGANLSYLTPGDRIDVGSDLIYEYRHPKLLLRPRVGVQVGAEAGKPFDQTMRLDLVPGFEIGGRVGIVRIGADARLLVPLAAGKDAPDKVGFGIGLSISVDLGGKKDREPPKEN